MIYAKEKKKKRQSLGSHYAMIMAYSGDQLDLSSVFWTAISPIHIGTEYIAHNYEVCDQTLEWNNIIQRSWGMVGESHQN